MKTRIPLIISLILFNSFSSPSFAQVDSTGQVKVREILDKFITSLGKNPEKYTITVEKSDVLNAYATVGKRIVVNSGLIKTLMSESGLAFVIAHELGHIEKTHVLHSFVRDHVFSAVKYFFFRNSAIYDGVNYMHSLYYNRDAERDADLFAEEMINKFYCNIPGKLEFFESVAKNQHAFKVSEYFSTHPLPQSRLDYLRKEIADAGCKL